MVKENKNQHGGSRPGAGRKKGSSAYGESTQAIRIPESMIPEIKMQLALRKQRYQQPQAIDNAYSAEIFTASANLSNQPIPLFSGKVAAGFPSPADDYVEKTLDLNELLIQKPAATFFVRAEGESMLNAGIHPNDILVVDRSLEPVVGKVAICALNGELTVKRIKSIGAEIILAAENPAYSDIVVKDSIELVIWGVVTNVIHAL